MLSAKEHIFLRLSRCTVGQGTYWQEIQKAELISALLFRGEVCFSCPWALPRKVCENEELPTAEETIFKLIRPTCSCNQVSCTRDAQGASQYHCKATNSHLWKVGTIKGKSYLANLTPSFKMGREYLGSCGPWEDYGANHLGSYFQVHERQGSDWEQPCIFPGGKQHLTCLPSTAALLAFHKGRTVDVACFDFSKTSGAGSFTTFVPKMVRRVISEWKSDGPMAKRCYCCHQYLNREGTEMMKPDIS